MQQKKALTIIECLLSIIILAVMFAAGMAFYFNAHASMRWSVHKRIALEMAGAELENIKNNGYAALPNPAPAGNLWQGPLAVAIDNISGQKNIYVYDIDANGDGATDYKQVRVVINWQDAGKKSTQSTRLDTYIAP